MSHDSLYHPPFSRLLTAATTPGLSSITAKDVTLTPPQTSEFYENVRLVVIDSLAAVIAPVLGGRDGFVGHSIMTQVARLLKDIAIQQDVAVLVRSRIHT